MCVCVFEPEIGGEENDEREREFLEFSGILSYAPHYVIQICVWVRESFWEFLGILTCVLLSAIQVCVIYWKCVKISFMLYLYRTRDPKLLEECDIVVDVGGVYDPEKQRYDHHQRCVH